MNGSPSCCKEIHFSTGSMKTSDILFWPSLLKNLDERGQPSHTCSELLDGQPEDKLLRGKGPETGSAWCWHAHLGTAASRSWFECVFLVLCACDNTIVVGCYINSNSMHLILDYFGSYICAGQMPLQKIYVLVLPASKCSSQVPNLSHSLF